MSNTPGLRLVTCSPNQLLYKYNLGALCNDFLSKRQTFRKYVVLAFGLPVRAGGTRGQGMAGY